MTIDDILYGKIEINEPIILDLINAPAMQRLKGVKQAGHFHPFISKATLTRFEHSVGVFNLLRKFGAPIEEQIAGLIHDVSHSAFSHCIDYALPTGSEKTHSYQDEIHDDFVKNSELAEIIERHGFDLDYILNDKNFPLKENNIPDICADRIDYAMRDVVNFEMIDWKGADEILNNLTVINGGWVFKDFTSAEIFASLFFELNRKYYAGLPSAIMFRTGGDCLRYALDKNYISESDLYTTDDAVLEKILNKINEDENLKTFFYRMDNRIKAVDNPTDFDREVYTKSRVVDPFCEYQDELKRVSEINESWKEIIRQELEPKKYFLKFEK
ncbi:MAG: HD domain-containing protein [Patescibacteria group bacterium]|nr:HD domain-containing protein [Patescibacteria group bacterium]MDD4663261.1 HD domain-containing protein [Caldisericia bacterium]